MTVGRREWIVRWALAAAVAGLLMACHGSDATNAHVANLDFSVQDMNGKTVRLADFKGHPILINFWATWCPPCKAEIPWFVDLAAKYREQGARALTSTPAQFAQLIHDDRIRWGKIVKDSGAHVE